MFSIFRSCCRRLFLLSLLLCWLPAQAQTEQQPAFISDNLVVYLHSGPVINTGLLAPSLLAAK